MSIEWTFKNDSYWINSCDKCCTECDKDSKQCEKHCLNEFIDNGFCGGCKYDD